MRSRSEDHRAGWTADRANYEPDLGRKLPMPLLVLWGERGSLTGKHRVALWKPWAEDVRGGAFPCGHFIPEEQQQMVIDRFLEFFG